MSTPLLTEKWVPIWPNTKPLLSNPPTPVNGQWLKAEGGAMVWRDPIANADDKWHMVGTAGEPVFLNGWRNYSPAPGGFQQVGFRKLSNDTLAFTGLPVSIGRLKISSVGLIDVWRGEVVPLVLSKARAAEHV